MHDFLSDLWPFQPDVVEAYSTLVAAVFAIVASFFAFRAYVKESRIERRLLDSDERGQASRVAAWIGPDPEPDPRARVDGNFIVIRNASETPIYRVRWRIQYNIEQVVDDTMIMVVPPSAVGQRFVIPQHFRAAGHRWEELDLADFTVGIDFIDSSGVGWRRDEGGLRRFDVRTV